MRIAIGTPMIVKKSAHQGKLCHLFIRRYPMIALTLLIPWCFLPAAHAQNTTSTFYVSTSGNDAWQGTLPEPNAEKTDGPWASLASARDHLRQKKAAGALTGPVQVQIRGGDYYVTEPVIFGPEDSGTAEAPISYEAYGGEQPVVHGGRRITGWRQEGTLWVADIPEARNGAWDFSALWVNGTRCTPARTPNPAHPAGDYPAESDFFYTQGPVMEKDPATGKENKSNTRFYYRPEDLRPWDTLEDAVVVVFHSWETSLLRVKHLDEANHILEFTGPACWPFGYWRPDQWYFVENLFEALDQPGEWFLNRRAGKIFYMPLPGEDMNTAEAVAPVAKQLLLLEGKPAEGKFAEHLQFKGLRFYFTEYGIEPQGHSDGQAAASIPAAVQATGARQCVFERCGIGHVGTYGVWFRAGCQDNRIAQCEIFDLGAGAVRLGESGDAPSENEIAQRNTVDNCFLHDGGRIFRGAVGVWVGRSSYNTISHNDICDFRYTGVSVGWSWGYAPSSAHDNIIAFNHIHDVGKGQLSDMGGIYTLGVSPGTILRNNYIHDIMSNPKVSGGWGLYTDEGSSEILIENNVVYNTLTGTFHQHYGKENRLQNNILAYSHGAQLIRSREEEHISFFFERNIVVFNNGLLLGSTWKNGNWRFDNNCYWDGSGTEYDFAGRTFDEWKGEGFDAHSVLADPGFENITARDFRLKADSPALGLGFKPIDVHESGLYGGADWVNAPKRISREPVPLPEIPAPVKIAEDFEAVPVDEHAPDAQAIGEEGAATIRVSAETAASGKQSLKFIDAAGLAHPFNPHLVYAPHLRGGLTSEQFAVRIGPGAVFFHEWRDDRNPYRIGPSVWISGDGTLTAGGKALTTITPGEWYHLDIACPLGQAATGTWNLSVAARGQAAQRFDGLACGHPQFRRLDWLGFVSNATETSVFYLDDLHLGTE